MTLRDLLVNRLAMYTLINHLRRQAFLDLEPSAVHLHEPDNFADADHLLVRQVSDMAFAEKREQMMFAHAEEVYVRNDHHFIVLDVEQSIVQKPFRIYTVAAG